jgi:hypothetical protein
MIRPIRREQQETPSYSALRRDAAVSARAFAAVVERDDASVEAVRLAEKRLTSVLSELRMVAAALADSHT